ncbi:hypothetical protein J6590_081000 [Homalodisca vitripennis]|nr:hypothetical protein J6590_081000 [Homalodisca vitripennis]
MARDCNAAMSEKGSPIVRSELLPDRHIGLLLASSQNPHSFFCIDRKLSVREPINTRARISPPNLRLLSLVNPALVQASSLLG